jgi:hypothetical protein
MDNNKLHLWGGKVGVRVGSTWGAVRRPAGVADRDMIRKMRIRILQITRNDFGKLGGVADRLRNQGGGGISLGEIECDAATIVAVEVKTVQAGKKLNKNVFQGFVGEKIDVGKDSAHLAG